MTGSVLTLRRQLSDKTVVLASQTRQRSGSSSLAPRQVWQTRGLHPERRRKLSSLSAWSLACL